MITDDLDDAIYCHREHGGYLYDLGNGRYEVTSVHPSERRSFESTREAMDYAFRLAEAGYDETRIKACTCHKENGLVYVYDDCPVHNGPEE